LPGAEVVVVSLHCCVEYRSEPTDAQVENARLNLQRNQQLFERGIAAGKEARA